MRAARAFLRAAGVLVQRAMRGCLVDRPHELAMLGGDLLGVAVRGGVLEALVSVLTVER